jgi:hypothetical protein
VNGRHQLLAYADNVTLLGDNTETIKKNKETLIDVSKEVGLEASIEKYKYMFVSRYWNADKIRDINIENR